jgi:cation:H+ antiporter
MTSIPELFVATFSVLSGTPGFSISDVLGSNVFNIGIVVGTLTVMGSLRKCGSGMLNELVDILFLSPFIPVVLVMFGSSSSLIGVVLLGIFGLGVYQMTRKRKDQILVSNEASEDLSRKRTVLPKIILGVVLVVVSAELTISSASNIASALRCSTNSSRCKDCGRRQVDA